MGASIWSKISIVLTLYTIYNQVKTLNQLSEEIYANVPDDLRSQLQEYLPTQSNLVVSSPIPSAIKIPTYAPKVSAYEHLNAGT